ncbi:MAG: hypothetical protein ACRCYO_10085 [Bacteroidia bacterium]
MEISIKRSVHASGGGCAISIPIKESTVEGTEGNNPKTGMYSTLGLTTASEKLASNKSLVSAIGEILQHEASNVCCVVSTGSQQDSSTGASAQQSSSTSTNVSSQQSSVLPNCKATAPVLEQAILPNEKPPPVIKMTRHSKSGMVVLKKAFIKTKVRLVFELTCKEVLIKLFSNNPVHDR